MKPLLPRLLAAWRETFDEALVEPIRRAGAEAARGRPGLRGKNQVAFEAAWHARLEAGDPADLDLLLEAKWPRTVAPIRRRLVALRRAPPDPRVPPRLLELAHAFPDGLGSDTSLALATAPTLELARLLEGHAPHTFGIARVALEHRVRTACDPALLDEARRALPPPQAPRTLDDVYANPSDLDVRAVLADELQTAGDPRGEFIALQLAIARGTADEAARKRADRLLDKHRDAWLRPFPNALPNACRFERGFPVAIASTAHGKLVERAAAEPAWATVEELSLDAGDADLEPLLRRMPALRSLATRDEALDRLEGCAPLPGIRALGAPRRWFPRSLAAFPDVAALAGTWANADDARTDYARLQGRARALRLQAIAYVRIRGRIAGALAYRDLGPPVARFTVTAEGGGRGWLVSVLRDEPRAAIEWGGGQRFVFARVRDILDDLLAIDIRDFACAATGPAREEIEWCVRNAKKRYAGRTVRFVDGPLVDLTRPPLPY